MEPERPDPEQLLLRVKKEESKEENKRGKLKIFFGACAGAGKTYAMLSAAQEKKNENIDVVAAIIETHGRLETGKLLTGIPKLPLRETEYHGIIVKELDLDAALAREPAILLVDELAHTNAVGSRHPKRWQDVQELLESGIDVYTTLNVQHLESLNDIVANLTGIRVKETIPDSLFDHADEIVLVDIPSEIILERLNEGKVYLGEFAKQRAAQHFFKIENLIALREIALRRTAERVDAQRDIYTKYQNKHALTDKILVCIGPGILAPKLVRHAKQIAAKLKSKWTALHVEDDKHYRLAKKEQNEIKKTLNLAEQLGGKSETIQSPVTVTAIIEYAHNNNFTKIIVGKSARPKWKHWLFGSLVNEIIEQSGNIDVYVINDETPQPKLQIQGPTQTNWFSLLTIFFIVGICTLLIIPAKGWLPPVNALMIYLSGVVTICASNVRSAGILAAMLVVLCYNFLFIYPDYHIKNMVTLCIIMITTLFISSITSRLRHQILFAKQREKYMSDLYSLSRKLIVTFGKAKIAKVVSLHIGEIFECAATVWLPDEAGYLELVSHPGVKADPHIKDDLKEESVAQWVYKHNQVAGLGTNTMPSARGHYIPISNGNNIFGVLGIMPKDPDRTFSVEENTLLQSLAIQTASAFQGTIAAEQMQKETSTPSKK